MTQEQVKKQLSRPKSDGLLTMLRKMAGQFTRAAPKGTLGGDRLVRILETTLRQNPDLLKCTPESLLGAAMNAASMGLTPHVLDECYLVPFWDGRRNQTLAQLQVGYKGYLKLAYQSKLLKGVQAHAVGENDLFDFQYGTEPFLRHKPSDQPGQAIAYYCCTKVDGEYSFSVMSRAQVEYHRDKFCRSGRNERLSPAWIGNFDAMAIKTVIRRHFKFLPLSPEIQTSIALDGTILEGPEEEPRHFDVEVPAEVVGEDQKPPSE